MSLGGRVRVRVLAVSAELRKRHVRALAARACKTTIHLARIELATFSV